MPPSALSEGMMPNRRIVLRSLAGLLVLGAGGCVERLPSRTKDFWGSDAATPKASLIKGTPDILDFGDGLKIPMDKSAFLVLWEGKDFWMTYGAGRESYREAASGEAVHYAESAMQLLLLTLAFTPERMVKVDGGWRLKEQNVKNYVRGMIALPGRAFWPIAQFDGGFGAGDASKSGTTSDVTASLSVPKMDASSMTMNTTPDSVVRSGKKVDAFTAYYVRKAEVSLDYVRDHAVVLMEKP